MEAISCFVTTQGTKQKSYSTIFINHLDEESIKYQPLTGTEFKLTCGKSLFIQENYSDLLNTFKNLREDRPRINLKGLFKFEEREFCINDITYMWYNSDSRNKTYFRFRNGEEIKTEYDFYQLLAKWSYYED